MRKLIWNDSMIPALCRYLWPYLPANTFGSTMCIIYTLHRMTYEYISKKGSKTTNTIGIKTYVKTTFAFVLPRNYLYPSNPWHGTASHSTNLFDPARRCNTSARTPPPHGSHWPCWANTFWATSQRCFGLVGNGFYQPFLINNTGYE